MNNIVLEEETKGCEHLEDEVRRYATHLGIDFKKEVHLQWIAREGLAAPVPHPWKTCTEDGLYVFYYNVDTGESIWDHPCDQHYRKMVEEHRAAHEALLTRVGPVSFAAAVTVSTERATPITPVSNAAFEQSVVRHFLPSHAMKMELNEMWCCRIMEDDELVAKIQSDVDARYDLNDIEVTQKEIDDAWLDAALDLLGRPAIRQTPSEDSYGTTQSDIQYVADMEPDYQEAVRHMLTVDVDWYDRFDAMPRLLFPFVSDNISHEATQDCELLHSSHWPDSRPTIPESSVVDSYGFDCDGDSPRPHSIATASA